MSNVSAAATGLPASIHALHDPMPRRGFLAGLTKLPLIGGSVALIGQPRAVAQPATRQILEAYKAWLHLEHRVLSRELAELPEMVAYYGGTSRERYDIIQPMTFSFGTGDAYRFISARAPRPPRAAPPSSSARSVAIGMTTRLRPIGSSRCGGPEP